MLRGTIPPVRSAAVAERHRPRDQTASSTALPYAKIGYGERLTIWMHSPFVSRRGGRSVVRGTARGLGNLLHVVSCRNKKKLDAAIFLYHAFLLVFFINIGIV